ncbi:MAG: Uma2 family endonuclease [Phototrophicaceae bacterium]
MEAILKTRLTADDYYQLPEYDSATMIQLIEGEVVVNMAPLLKHQDIVGNIFVFLKQLIKQIGGRVYIAPAEVYLNTHNVYEPDVFYLAPDSAAIITEKNVIGAPDLVVEVLSPTTAKYDRQTKFNAYAAAGVREYWVVDPLHNTLEVWQGQSQAFHKLGTYDPADTFTSPVLGGQSIPVSALLLIESV